MSQLHDDVVALAGNNPALVFSKFAIESFLLSGVREAVRRMTDQSVPIEGNPQVSIQLAHLTPLVTELGIALSTADGQLYASVTPNFSALFHLHATNYPPSRFSDIQIDVTDLKFAIEFSAPNMQLSPDYDCTGTIMVAATRPDALEQSGLTESAIASLEGALAFLIPRKIVDSAFAGTRCLSVLEMFPSFGFQGHWRIGSVTDGVVIYLDNSSLASHQRECPTSDTTSSLSIYGQLQEPVQNGNGEIYTFPVTARPPPLSNLGEVGQHGFASLYAPLPLWRAQFEKAMPAVTYHDQNNGFLGYDLTFTAGLSNAEVSIDPSRYGIILSMTMNIYGYAYITVDVPCIGRKDLGYARCTMENSSISIILRLTANGGKLFLVSEIDQLNLGSCIVTTEIFGKYAAAAGGEAAIAGFIADFVIGRVLHHNLPIELRHMIQREVNSRSMELMDASMLLPFGPTSIFLNEPTFDGDTNSVLVGLGTNG